MPYSEINAVCSQIHTKHINTLCGQNAVSYIQTAGTWCAATAVRCRRNEPVWSTVIMSAE
jgi:hypothetical protein